jgi:tRNA-2-methylthio-N6-dimethylallyladenosine synthase
MFCSFCVVPHTRGREISRGWRGILDEVKSLARAGVSEVTLLGQTVNAYGRHDLRRGKAEAQGTRPFAELLQEIDAVPGIRRIRYTSPHPIFFDDALIDAHRSLESLCPHVHLPAQSGSDRILERMRRRYDAERLLGIVSALREARPDVAITTDLIVGFPGEDDDDFEATLSLVRDAGFVDSFSFKYSPRPGTPAPHDRDQVPGDRAQSRLEALQSRQREQTLAYHRSRVGSRTHALVTGPSRRGGDQWQGRDPHNRVVNFLAPENVVRVGDLVEVCIEEATPHSLIGEITPEALKDPQQRAEEGTLV